MTDYLQICLDLIKSTKDNIRESLIQQEIPDIEAQEIIEALDMDQELIFSLNKSYEKSITLDELCSQMPLDSKLPDLFRMKWKLYSHQVEAIRSIYNETCTVISSGTGSGKTESFLIPIINHCLENSAINGIKAIIIYPINSLAGDQLRRLRKILDGTKITFGIFNGQTPENAEDEAPNMNKSRNELFTRTDMVTNPPDILITNYVMLDRIMNNPKYSSLIDSSVGTLKYIVLDEIHTYRGNKGLHIRGLIGRLKNKANNRLVFIGCSATLRNAGQWQDAYISGDLNTYIESFIKQLFWLDESDSYKYIEPIYERTKEILNRTLPSEYLSFKNSEITKSIINILEAGPASLGEIFRSLQNKNLIKEKQQLLEYFKKVMQLNLKYPDFEPVLDFSYPCFSIEDQRHFMPMYRVWKILWRYYTNMY